MPDSLLPLHSPRIGSPTACRRLLRPDLRDCMSRLNKYTFQNYSWSFLNYSYFCTSPETLPDMKEIQQEITTITNEDLFIILNHPNAHFDYPIHCHPEYEKIITIRSSNANTMKRCPKPTSGGAPNRRRKVMRSRLRATGSFAPHGCRSTATNTSKTTISTFCRASAARSGFRRNSPGTNSTGCCESPICNKPDKPTIRL